MSRAAGIRMDWCPRLFQLMRATRLDSQRRQLQRRVRQSPLHRPQSPRPLAECMAARRLHRPCLAMITSRRRDIRRCCRRCRRRCRGPQRRTRLLSGERPVRIGLWWTVGLRFPVRCPAPLLSGQRQLLAPNKPTRRCEPTTMPGRSQRPCDPRRLRNRSRFPRRRKKLDLRLSLHRTNALSSSLTTSRLLPRRTNLQ